MYVHFSILPPSSLRFALIIGPLPLLLPWPVASCRVQHVSLVFSSFFPLGMISGFDCLAGEINLIAAFLSLFFFSFPHTQFELGSEAVITWAQITQSWEYNKVQFAASRCWRGLAYNLIEMETLTVGVFFNMLLGNVAINLTGLIFASCFRVAFSTRIFSKIVFIYYFFLPARHLLLVTFLKLLYADSSYLFGMASQHSPNYEKVFTRCPASHYPLCVYMSQY